MKTWNPFMLLAILIIFGINFTTCDNGDNNKYPSLKVVNQYQGRSILSVRLVGYEFNNLLISPGNSQTFTLMQGMPGGYNNINVTVNYGGSISNKFNFNNGKTTTITLKGGGGEGSPYYNNTVLE